MRYAFALVLLSLSAMAVCGEWEKARDKDGVVVFTRDVEGSPYKAFKGETELAVELNRALALMDDTAACVDWMHSCKSPKLIRKLSPLERYTYMVNDLPWPVADRALLLRALITQEYPSRVVTVALTSLDPQNLAPAVRERVPNKGDIVLIEQAEGFFRFTPLGENRTHVEYQMHTDPRGSLPASLVNARVVDTPFYTLKKMRELVAEPRYRDFRPF